MVQVITPLPLPCFMRRCPNPVIVYRFSRTRRWYPLCKQCWDFLESCFVEEDAQPMLVEPRGPSTDGSTGAS